MLVVVFKLRAHSRCHLNGRSAVGETGVNLGVSVVFDKM